MRKSTMRNQIVTDDFQNEVGARRRSHISLRETKRCARTYRYVQRFVDKKGGVVRLYFRRPGYPCTPLPGPLGGPNFVSAYNAALLQPKLPPPSALPGGVRKHDRRNPNAVQPLVGVYLLLLRGQIVYIGENLNMPKRVASHRTNGRPFDQVYYIPTMANQRRNLEQILIRSFSPRQNQKGRGEFATLNVSA
jgi:hypothetical protein